MKFAACLGVKDEIELIRPAIAHLRSIGVDHIIASDAHSADGTSEVLAELARGTDFEHVFFDDRTSEPGHEAAADADIMDRARAAGADWLIFADADEFPLPRSGQLRDVAALASADALTINRYNVPLLASGPALRLPVGGLDDVLLYAPDENRFAIQTRIRNDAEAPWIGVIPAPKMMVRLDRVETIGEGHHVLGSGAGLTSEVPDDLIIAHVPFSTTSRFARKVTNIRAQYAAIGHQWGPDTAWHWRRWLDNVAQRGGVAGEMARNRVTVDELAKLHQIGVIRTAAEILGLTKPGRQGMR